MLRSHDETTWTLADLRKQLRNEVETKESSLGQSDKEVSVSNPSFNSKFPTAGILFFGALGRENAKNDCTFCDRPHPSDLCKTVPTIDQRLEFLRNQKRCFRCFKKGHMSKVLLLEEAIGAQSFKKEELMMSTFGHDKRTKADIKMVRVCLMADGEGIIIDALVSPVMSPPISAHLQDDDLNFPYSIFKGFI